VSAPLLGGDVPPASLESLAGGGDGDVDILLAGLVDAADDLFVGGVDDLERLAVDTLDELVVDEAGSANVSSCV